MQIKVIKEPYFEPFTQTKFTGSYEPYQDRTPIYNAWETEDVDMETLMNYIKKGYSIKINC